MFWNALLSWYDGYAASFKTGDRELEGALAAIAAVICIAANTARCAVRRFCEGWLPGWEGYAA